MQFLLLLSVLSFVSSVNAQGVETGTFADGWNTILSDSADSKNEEFMKTLVVRSIYEGLMFGESPYIGKAPNQINIDYESVKTTISYLNKFYTIRENKCVPIVWALHVRAVQKGIFGKEKADLLLNNYRNVGNANFKQCASR